MHRCICCFVVHEKLFWIFCRSMGLSPFQWHRDHRKFHEQRRQSYGRSSLSTGLVDGLFSIKDTTKDMVIFCFDIMIVNDYISLR